MIFSDETFCQRNETVLRIISNGNDSVCWTNISTHSAASAAAVSVVYYIRTTFAILPPVAISHFPGEILAGLLLKNSCK